MTTWYNVGIRFSPLIGDSSTTAEEAVEKRHWALVFSSQSEHNIGRLIEVVPREGGSVAMVTTGYDVKLPYHPLAKYQGQLADTDRILEAHPMRHSAYSPFFNNCQHFAASFLLLLEAFTCEGRGRSFVVTHPERMIRVQSVLKRNGIKLYHEPNTHLQMARLRVMAGTTATCLVGTYAAQATVAATVPASGIMGWLGATTTVVAPAAYAAFAASIVPVAAGATVFAMGWYRSKAREWKGKTLFNDPRLTGFPRELKGPLKPEERTAPAVTQHPIRMLFPQSSSSVSCPESVLLPAMESTATSSNTTLFSTFRETTEKGLDFRLKRD